MNEAASAQQVFGLRRSVADFVESAGVQRLIIALILANAVTLGLETFPSVVARSGDALHVLDRTLLAVFVLELALKLFGHGFRFFRSGWNLFDFAIIGIALLPSTGAFTVLRALRVLRVLRLVSAVPKMRFVVESLGRSLPGLGSIGFLLMIFFYVFAVMATKLFGAGFPHWFGGLATSMFSLFQIMTLEGWADIAREVMTQQPGAWIFFLVFILLATFTVLNLFIAVIVNAMQEPHTPIEHRPVATSEDIARLRAEIAELRRTLGQLKPKG
jgi:voltage-gated sodium channel